jgi:hypothetical protein
VIIVITFIFDVKLGIKVDAICHSSQTYKIEESLGPESKQADTFLSESIGYNCQLFPRQKVKEFP